MYSPLLRRSNAPTRVLQNVRGGPGHGGKYGRQVFDGVPATDAEKRASAHLGGHGHLTCPMSPLRVCQDLYTIGERNILHEEKEE